MMEFVWDFDKAKANWTKHRISFETAILIFDDPMLISEADPHSDDDRWRIIGRIVHQTLFVVYATTDDNNVTRIISARRATLSERKRYDDGYS